MIDFYKDGSVVGVVFSGIIGAFILVYLVLEFSNVTITSMTMFSKIFYYIKVRKYIKSIIPHWWDVGVSFFLIRKTDQIGPLTGIRVIEIPVKVIYKRNKLSLIGYDISYKSEKYSAVSYIEYIDGEIRLGSHLLEFIEKTDKKNGIDPKQMNRDRILNNLGIK